jgi:predicted dehydrogenase
LKILVIGYGSIAKRHVKNLLKITDFEIIVYTNQTSQKKKNCTFYSSINDCLDKKPNAAIIANVTSEHKKIIQLLIKNKIPLFIEKPLSNSYLGIDELVKDIKINKIPTLMGCQFRFHTCIKKIKELLDENKIGKVLSVKVECGSYLPNWHKNEDYRLGYAGRKDLGGGVVLTCIHELDYLYWLFGDVEQVFSITGKFSNLEINADDLSVILMKFKNKTIAEVHLDYFQKPEIRSCKIIGTNGTLYWDSLENSVNYFDLSKNKWIKIIKVKNYDRNQMYVDELKHFFSCIDSKIETINPIIQGAKTLKIALGILKSSKLKKMVKI